MGYTSMVDNFKGNKNFYQSELAGQFSGRAVVLDFSIVGNEIYQLVQVEAEIFINLIIVSREGGHIYWKQIDETCYPYYFKCPVKFLQRSTCTTGSAERWRADCLKARRQAVEAKSLIAQIKSLASGSIVEMVSGRKVIFEFTHNRNRFAGRLADVAPGKQNSIFAWRYSEVAKIV